MSSIGQIACMASLRVVYLKNLRAVQTILPSPNGASSVKQCIDYRTVKKQGLHLNDSPALNDRESLVQ